MTVRNKTGPASAGSKVAVIGGGLAGLAAATALVERGSRVELYESRRKLGGRAASFRDPTTGELVDHCQHVGMACCTNLVDFCRRMGIADLFRRDRTLHFFAPDGKRCDIGATPLLPAPMHLLPSLLRLSYLSWSERLGICRAMLRLARTSPNDDRATAGDWLREQRQSERAIERFWGPVIVSALGESVERASLKYVRKVFVDGFLANRSAYEIDVPTVALGELYGERLEAKLRELGATITCDAPTKQIDVAADGRLRVELHDGRTEEVDAVVLAVAWRKAAELLSPELRRRWPACERWQTLSAAPISGVHLWFDRELIDLPHAVLVGSLSQWMFNRARSAERGTRSDAGVSQGEYYYQVVISASYDLAGRDRASIVAQVVEDLRAVFPAARGASLLRSKIVTEPEAVFSVGPGVDAVRPAQASPIAGLFVAGDWTATGWPATMEGAVRSGYLAAEGVMQSFGRPERIVVADLPRSLGARLLCGRS